MKRISSIRNKGNKGYDEGEMSLKYHHIQSPVFGRIN